MQNDTESDPTDVAKLDMRGFLEGVCDDSILLSSSSINSTRILTLQFHTYQEK